MKAVILAGGFGTRLKEHVPDVPKPMAPIADRPFLEYLLDRLCDHGIREVILSLGYKANFVQSHFGDQYREIKLDYKVEGSPLGTGGAIVHALEGEPPDPYLVLNGDTFLDISFIKLIEWYQDQPTPVAMVLKSVSDVSRYGVVEVENSEVVGFREKGDRGPGLINAGIYILNSRFLESKQLPKTFSLEQDLLQPNIDTLRPRAFISNDWFIDIGIPVDYDKAQTELPAVVS